MHKGVVADGRSTAQGLIWVGVAALLVTLEQLASEAALESWSWPVRGLPPAETGQLPRPVVDGVPFE